MVDDTKTDPKQPSPTPTPGASGESNGKSSGAGDPKPTAAPAPGATRSVDGEKGKGPDMVTVERIDGKPLLSSFSVPLNKRSKGVRAPIDESVFQMDLQTAIAAVKTGSFRVSATSKVQIKEGVL